MPKNDRLPVIIIEAKTEENCSEDDLKKSAEGAFDRMREKQYPHKLHENGISSFYGYGVAFSGMNIEVIAKDYDCRNSLLPIRRKWSADQ